MSAVKQRQPTSVEDYLAGELVSPIKHEYIDGYVYAMSGARNVHNDIAINISGELRSRLRDKPRKPCNSDTKVRIPRPPKERFFYPDAFVVCKASPPELSYQERPVVIFEVISESTRRTDEWEKKEAYMALPTLCVYALVEQLQPLVTLYRRQGQEFVREVYNSLEAVIPLKEIECELPMAEIYHRVEFSPDDPPPDR
jgi:Uma2 family endonuclease